MDLRQERIRRHVQSKSDGRLRACVTDVKPSPAQRHAAAKILVTEAGLTAQDKLSATFGARY
ncbi:MAG: hypothetical protein NVSMB13_14150 [Mycobacteriales bacterium]